MFNLKLNVKTECRCNMRSVKAGHKCVNSLCSLLGRIQKTQLSESIAGVRAQVGNIKISSSIFNNKSIRKGQNQETQNTETKTLGKAWTCKWHVPKTKWHLNALNAPRTEREEKKTKDLCKICGALMGRCQKAGCQNVLLTLDSWARKHPHSIILIAAKHTEIWLFFSNKRPEARLWCRIMKKAQNCNQCRAMTEQTKQTKHGLLKSNDVVGQIYAEICVCEYIYTHTYISA